MLKAAFNSLIRFHSRPAVLKRLGNPDIFTLIRIMPANYFRFLRGAEYTTVAGVEFIIPKDSAVGHLAQKLSLNKVPTSGNFKISFGVVSTTSLPYNADAPTIQAAVRLLANLQNVIVTGDFTSGFKFTLIGASSPIGYGDLTESTLANGSDSMLIDTWSHTNTPWDKPILKSDRIVDGTNLWAVSEIIDMYDVGATVMGWRVRAD